MGERLIVKRGSAQALCLAETCKRECVQSTAQLGVRLKIVISYSVITLYIPPPPTSPPVSLVVSTRFNSSATDLSLSHLINTILPPSSSLKGKSSALLTSTKNGEGHINKAMPYLLDSDPTPDSAPTQCGFWACRIPAMNLLPLKLPH